MRFFVKQNLQPKNKHGARRCARTVWRRRTNGRLSARCCSWRLLRFFPLLNLLRFEPPVARQRKRKLFGRYSSWKGAVCQSQSCDAMFLAERHSMKAEGAESTTVNKHPSEEESGEAHFNLGFRWTMEAAEAATSALQNVGLVLPRL
ncbi:unnamed protein product [Symbiodinium sp. CCMP2456]|nr:unnamed protein product [Symbiodinium sp. CCMP2456]